MTTAQPTTSQTRALLKLRSQKEKHYLKNLAEKLEVKQKH